VRATLDLQPHRQDTTDILRITLNGERVELEQPLSVIALLEKLDIDPRRVAVEHNLTILKRHRFPEVVVGDGDSVEIVNFVGGG
jgi:sulfur carrier protein